MTITYIDSGVLLSATDGMGRIAEKALEVLADSNRKFAVLGWVKAWLGAGRRFANLILLTLGTGVGGAIILDRKLFVGHQGAAGELGLKSPITNL